MRGIAEIRCGLPRREDAACGALFGDIQLYGAGDGRARWLFLPRRSWMMQQSLRGSPQVDGDPAILDGLGDPLPARDAVRVYCSSHDREYELPWAELVAAALEARAAGRKIKRLVAGTPVDQ